MSKQLKQAQKMVMLCDDIFILLSCDVINMQDSFVIIFHYVSNCEICLHYWVQMSILEHFAFRGEKLSQYSDNLKTRNTKQIYFG